MRSSYNTGGGPAFPVTNDAKTDEAGMSMLEYYAGQALIGLLSNPNRAGSYTDICQQAFQFGEEMVRESRK